MSIKKKRNNKFVVFLFSFYKKLKTENMATIHMEQPKKLVYKKRVFVTKETKCKLCDNLLKDAQSCTAHCKFFREGNCHRGDECHYVHNKCHYCGETFGLEGKCTKICKWASSEENKCVIPNCHYAHPDFTRLKNNKVTVNYEKENEEVIQVTGQILDTKFGEYTKEEGGDSVSYVRYKVITDHFSKKPVRFWTNEFNLILIHK